jgi:flagellar biosynthesis protein FliR
MVAELLVLARCAGFVFRAPGFSHPSVSLPLRGGLTLALAMLIAPSIHVEQHSLLRASLVAELCMEFLLGSGIGMAASLVYDAAYAGGRTVDDYVGVKAIAPSIVLVAPSGFGRVWSLAFTGAFFLSGAYRLTLLGFAQSFERIPVETSLPVGTWATFASAFAENFFLVALQAAAPAVGLAFVVQIGLGAVSRVIPRFGSFTLFFPLAFVAALAATAIVVPQAAEHAPRPITFLRSLP